MISPRGMELRDWCDSMTFDLEVQSNGSVPRLNGLDWRSWAVRAIALTAQRQQDAPDPYGFEDWRDWAERFQLALGTNS